MRLSSLIFAVVLLFSSLSFAQHSTATSPAPSPAPAAAPPAAPPPAAAAPSAAPSAPSVSHTSMPSSPAPTSMPVSHSAPVVNSSPATSSSRSSESNTVRSAPAAHTPEPERVQPSQRVSDEGRIVPALRIGEKPPEKAPEKKSPESDLRRPVCNGENCKEPVKKPEPAESDLRRPVCLNGHCPCTQQQAAGKENCGTTPVINPGPQCPGGKGWNGTACVDYGAGASVCPPGEIRNGASCEPDCSAVRGLAQSRVPDVRSARQQRDGVCRNDPSGTECGQADGHYQAVLNEYRNIWASAPIGCQSTLPVPDTL